MRIANATRQSIRATNLIAASRFVRFDRLLHLIMFDRLQQLRRQKAILEEHLAWIDHEIAEAQGDAPPPAVPTISTVPSAPGTTTTHTHHPSTLGEIESSASTKAMVRAEEIISQHKIAQASAPDDIRRGCLLLVAVGFTILGIAFLLLWQFGPRL